MTQKSLFNVKTSSSHFLLNKLGLKRANCLMIFSHVSKALQNQLNLVITDPQFVTIASGLMQQENWTVGVEALIKAHFFTQEFQVISNSFMGDNMTRGGYFGQVVKTLQVRLKLKININLQAFLSKNEVEEPLREYNLTGKTEEAKILLHDLDSTRRNQFHQSALADYDEALKVYRKLFSYESLDDDQMKVMQNVKKMKQHFKKLVIYLRKL
ncbi:hypothetical protein OXYTRIMIC_732 [Oxytricha trifallax]|uniref:Uncharacterized protein n=1 Tax=Oxytricha trifallax TaxID=1172189 RepID=A0A073HX00_9SPIT|nr:hypothetical protein OXYTRIMIC_732 [Oxytricha trifallax]